LRQPPSRSLLEPLRRSGLVAGFLAIAAGGVPAFQAAPVRDFHRLELLLDRIDGAQVSSPILDAPRLDRIDLDLDSLQVEQASEDGTRRQWRLPLSIRHDDAAEKSPPLLVDAAGAPAGPDVRLEILPLREDFPLLSVPQIAALPRWRISEGGRFPIVSRPMTIGFDVPRAGVALKCTVDARPYGEGSDGEEPPSPALTIRVDGEEQGEVVFAVDDRAVFTLAPKSGTSRFSLEFTGTTAQPRGSVMLQSLVLEAVDRVDRVVVVAPKESRGLKLRYLPAPPRGSELLLDTGAGAGAATAARGRELALEPALLAGKAVVVAGLAQEFEVALDGGAPLHTQGRSQELEFDVPADGFHRLVVRSRAPTIAGKLWLIQPRALLLPLRQPELTRIDDESSVRGFETRDGSPLVRHVMIEDATRRALLAPAPTTFALPIEAGGDVTLEFAVGVIGLARSMPRAPVEVAISVEDSAGRVRELFSERFREGVTWLDRKVVLPADLAGRATLRIVTRAPARGAPSARDSIIAVGEPTLVRGGAARRPNLIVYLVDTLRADHCSPYGYARATTPQLARFAADGLLFENAFSQAPWTRPSVATLLTSRLYSFHGAGKSTGLAPELTTLAECLRSAGFATSGFIANAHVHGSSLNFEQGFSCFDAMEKGRRRGLTRAGAVQTGALQWIAAHRDRPFFAYVHTVDPHAPYDPPPETLGTFGKDYHGLITPALTTARTLVRRSPLEAADLQHVVDLYDEEVLSNDIAFGDFIDQLHALGVWDDTIVVFMSDHGEEFYDHGSFGHGMWLWNELLHVPLVIKPDRRPGETAGAGPAGNGAARLAGVRFGERVRVLDLMPTLLARLGVAAPPEGLMGVDLHAAFDGGELPELPVIAEEETNKSCLLSGPLKYILFGPKSLSPGRNLFDLSLDPHELNDLATSRPELAARMDEQLKALLAEFEARGFTRVHDAAKEQLGAADRAALKRLGYVAGDGGEGADGAGAAGGARKKPAGGGDDDR
jgi:arylsulfatase A-like enzyme